MITQTDKGYESEHYIAFRMANVRNSEGRPLSGTPVDSPELLDYFEVLLSKGYRPIHCDNGLVVCEKITVDKNP